MTEETLAGIVSSAVAKAGIGEPSPETMRELDSFAREVVLRGTSMHLVGKRGIEKNIGLLVLDSLLMLRVAEEQGIIPRSSRPHEVQNRRFPFKVADIGSGAGFPGIVWSVFRPHLDVTLFERKERTHAFLERVIAILAMGGVRALAEDAADKPHAGSFDLAISKAAGRLRELLPLAEKLVQPGGAYLTIKGGSWREELDGAKSSAMRFERAAELPEGRGYSLTFRKG